MVRGAARLASNTTDVLLNCRNNLDDSLLNRCLLENPTGFLHMTGDVIQPFVNPRSLSVAAAMIVVGLPVCINQVLDVMLYTVFRQRRPCSCSWDGGAFVQVGSTYGMPSGDSMSGALFAAWLWDMASSHSTSTSSSSAATSAVMRATSFVVALAVMVERMSWGWHSLAQTSAGASLGVFLYFWSTRVPLYFALVETVITIPLSFFLLLTDPARAEWGIPGTLVRGGNMNNLLAWLIWGFAFQLLAAILLLRHFSALGVLSRMRLSFQDTMHALAHAQDNYTLVADQYQTHAHTKTQEDGDSCAPSESVSQRPPARAQVPATVGSWVHFTRHFCDDVFASARDFSLLVDLPFTLVVAALCSLLIFLQAGVMHYSWISSHGLCNSSSQAPTPPSWCFH